MLKEHQPKASLLEVCLVFLRLGTLSFGDPAAHIAMMENKFVQKRQCMERDKFLVRGGGKDLRYGVFKKIIFGKRRNESYRTRI